MITNLPTYHDFKELGIACNQKFDIERIDCCEEDCSGNVIGTKLDAAICLTCHWTQSE